MTMLLLPPAPPEIERYELAKEAFGPSALRAAESLSSAIEPLIDALKRMCEAFGLFTETMGKTADAMRRFQSAYAASRLDLQPSERYRLAGCPYQKTQRGKKRWLLEQKRRARGITAE